MTLAERLPMMPSGGAAIELDDGPGESLPDREVFVTTTAVAMRVSTSRAKRIDPCLCDRSMCR